MRFTFGAILPVLLLAALEVNGQSTFHTLNSFNVITDPPNVYSSQNYLFFAVTACNDATIWLTNEFGEYTELSYGVTLGGESNQVTSVRECWFCPITVQVASPAVVDCDFIQYFWMTWLDNAFSIGQGVSPGMNVLIPPYAMQPGFIVTYIGLNTANGATGTWILPEQYFISMNTPSFYNLTNIGPTNTLDSSMVFNVEACRNVIVSLNQDVGLNIGDDSYEFAFGFFDANATDIRPCHQCPAVVRVLTPGIIQCGVTSTLWVGWNNDNNTVTAGTGPLAWQNPIISWQNTGFRPPRVEYIQVSGSPDSGNGVWTMPRLRYDFGYDTGDGFLYYDAGFLAGETYMLIDVTACNNAVVVLGNTRTLTQQSDFYEFTIGAVGNTQSILRECRNANCNVLASVPTANLLSCTEARQFWVYWDFATDDIALGTGWLPGENGVIFYNDNNLMDITFGGVSTLEVFAGYWTFPRTHTARVNTLPTNPLQYTDIGFLDTMANGFFTFDVAAVHSAYITLETAAPLPNSIFQGYQIVIEDDNQDTSIYRCDQNVCTMMASDHTPNLLTKQSSIKFWVSFIDGVVAVGEGWTSGENPVMSWTDPAPWPVNIARVATPENTGHWRFPNGGCYRLMDVGNSGDRPTCPVLG